MTASSGPSTDSIPPSSATDEFASLLEDRGLSFAGHGLGLDGLDVTRWRELRRLVSQRVPWVSRRLRDLAPPAAAALLGLSRRTT